MNVPQLHQFKSMNLPRSSLSPNQLLSIAFSKSTHGGQNTGHFFLTESFRVLTNLMRNKKKKNNKIHNRIPNISHKLELTAYYESLVIG